MAVSLSAGFGMRSDFMISDAAMPMRLEEADFAGILAQTDVAGAAENALPSDIQKLAEMTASGELDIEDIPQELVTAEFVKLVAQLKQSQPAQEQEIPETEKDESDTVVAAAFVQMDISDDVSAEFDEIVKAVTDSSQQTAPVEKVTQSVFQESAFETEETAAEQPMINIQAEQTAQTTQTVQTQAEFSVQTEESGEVQTQQAGTAQPTQQLQPKTNAVQQQAKSPEPNGETQMISVNAQPSESGENSADNNAQEFFSQTQTAPAQTVQNRAEQHETLKNAEFTVEVRREQPQTAQSAQTEMQLGAQAGQGRVKAAGEELELLRNAVRKPDGEQSAQHTQTPLTADSPVIFTAQDGREIEIKPAEVAQQVTQKLIETAQQTDSRETEYTMTLNPEELGEITVKLTKAADGAVSVTIAAENSRTRELLQQNSALIQENLRANGMQLESWQTVSESQQETYAQDYSGSSKNPYQREENAQQDGGDAEDNTFAELIASM